MKGEHWLGLVTIAVVVACAGKADERSTTTGAAGAPGTGATQLRACDPLAPQTSPVRLEPSLVAAAGRADDGTIYVVYDEVRLFVGSEQGLLERYVTGSGQSGSTLDLSFTDDSGASVTVEVRRDLTGTRMVVAQGPQQGKGVDSGNGGALTPLDAASAAALDASTTVTFTLDFAASLEDGRELVVVAPEHGASYEDFRVFIGPPAAVEEKAVTDFGSTRSGQRYATIVVDGASADLTYFAGGPSVLNPKGSPSTLTITSTVYVLTEGPVPRDVAYLCLSR